MWQITKWLGCIRSPLFSRFGIRKTSSLSWSRHKPHLLCTSYHDQSSVAETFNKYRNSDTADISVGLRYGRYWMTLTSFQRGYHFLRSRVLARVVMRRGREMGDCSRLNHGTRSRRHFPLHIVRLQLHFSPGGFVKLSPTASSQSWTFCVDGFPYVPGRTIYGTGAKTGGFTIPFLPLGRVSPYKTQTYT